MASIPKISTPTEKWIAALAAVLFVVIYAMEWVYVYGLISDNFMEKHFMEFMLVAMGLLFIPILLIPIAFVFITAVTAIACWFTAKVIVETVKGLWE
jgi:sugar phosphate permease